MVFTGGVYMKKLASGLLVIMLAFVLAGCGSIFGPLPDPVAEAQAYLENKYDEEFNVKNLSGNGAGDPFASNEYAGLACAAKEPVCVFDVWSTGGQSAFHDNYYAIEIMKDMDTWLKESGQDIWDDFKVRGQVRVTDAEMAPDYREGELEDFLQSEFVRCNIFLYLREGEEDITDKIYDYMQEIKTARSGSLYIRVLDKDTYNKLNVYAPFAEEYKYQTTIAIGSGKKTIKDACAGFNKKAQPDKKAKKKEENKEL